MSNFRNDRPVYNANQNVVWGEDDVVIRKIDDMVNEIMSFFDNSSVSSKTFAVYGPWGSGKSSILFLIKNRLKKKEAERKATRQTDTPLQSEEEKDAEQQAGTRDKPKASTPTSRLNFAYYEASTEELNNSHGDASQRITLPATLMMRVIQGLLSEDNESKVLPNQILTGLNRIFQSIKLGIDKVANDRGMTDAQKIQFWARQLGKLPDLENQIERILMAKPQEPAAMVIFIDDLDRCSPSFIWDVLITIQRWSRIDNLFFVIAVDREILYNAVHKAMTGTQRENQPAPLVLEKYIQFSFDVPAIEDRTRVIVPRLLDGLKGFSLSSTDKINGVINNQAESLVLSVLRKPNAADMIRYGVLPVTPRSIKRILNQAIPDLVSKARSLLNRTEEEQENSLYRELKRILLEMRWPIFYRELYTEAIDNNNPQHMFLFSQIQSHAVDAMTGRTGQLDDIEYFRFRANRTLSISPVMLPTYSQLFGSEREEKAFAKLLSIDPPFEFETKKGDSFEDRTGRKASLGEEVEIPEGTDPEQLIFQLYYASETADKVGQRDEVLRLSRQILAVAKQYQARLRASITPTIGNAAINAENSRDFELAYGLYDVSYQLDPTHANNMQNYADFIIQKDQRQLFELAETLLGRLENKYAAYRPERTMRLRVLFNRKLGRSTELTQDQINTIYDAFMQNPADQRRFASTMQLFQSVGRFDYVRRVGKSHLQTTETESQRYVALRGYADTMAASNDKKDEFTAMQIYFCMLVGDIWYPIDSVGDFVDVRHKFAVLLYKHDWDKTAGDLWFDAQRMKPQDPQIRRAYAMYLAQAVKRADLAQKVASGIALDDGDKPEGATDKQPLPPKFIDGGCQDPFGIQDPPTNGGDKPGGFDFGSLFKGYGGTPPGNN